MKVCLVLEGSYPFTVGGVSEWTHRLIQGLKNVQFSLWTISPTGDEEPKYELPENVVAWHRVALEKNTPTDLPTSGDPVEAWNEITRFHLEMLDGRFGRFPQVLRFLSGPKRRLNLHRITRDEQSWRLVSFFHKSNDAVNPFVEYYWGWYSSHLPFLKLLEQPVPPADVYHAISTGYAGFLASLAKLRTGRPMLLTEHGIYAKEREIEIYGSDIVKGYQRQMWSNVFQGLAKIAYDQADLIISLYERNRAVQLSMGAQKQKTRVIPNGIEVDRYNGLRDPNRKPLPHIGFVGRVAPIKDVKTFIRAARIIRDALPRAKFSVIGPTEENPEYFDQCKRLVEHLELNGALHFLGRRDVREVYPDLDLVMLTSVKEAQPLVLMEAMCAGVPVVATDVGDTHDLLAPEWPVTPPKDPEALAKAALQILRNPEKTRALAEKARRRVVQNYDIRKLIQEYGVLYKRYAQA